MHTSKLQNFLLLLLIFVVLYLSFQTFTLKSSVTQLKSDLTASSDTSLSPSEQSKYDSGLASIDYDLFHYFFNSLYSREDQVFAGYLANSESWATYKHPEGLFEFKYPRGLSINLSESAVESPYSNIEITSPNSQFRINVSHDIGGGGSLCANSSCYDLESLGPNNPELKFSDNAGIYSSQTDGRWRSVRDDKFMYANYFEPIEVSKYFGRLSALYENESQREVLAKILNSFVFYPSAYAE